jgi:hypothetical protein
MKNLLSIIAMAIVITSCESKANERVTTPANNNYVVVLDLSDRIIQRADQTDIDTTAIRAVFEKFEKTVQRNLTVKSADKFCVRIIPQNKSSLPVSYFENSLSIDMGKFNAAEKLKKLEAFKSDFSNQLKGLYQQAFLGNKNSDFAGVDIWQYFNEQINSDLDAGYNNTVLVLTDGYFDFEDKQHGFTDKQHSSTTTPLLNKMTGNEWKAKADSLDLGLIPVKLNVPAVWQICGIQSKAGDNDLLEAEKLSYLWSKWLKTSGGTIVKEPIMNSSSKKIQGLIAKSI